MRTFLIIYHFDINLLDQIADLRSQHQRYIQKHKNLIQYGGVFSSVENISTGIIITILAKDCKVVVEFVKNDPYFPLYENYIISNFEQKIPIQNEA
jgi:uncharacterized protein YciI